MEWINIWKKEPPRNTEIWFYTGDGTVHLGEIFSEEKLRKCSFHSYYAKDDYDCDANTAYEDRVLYWFPLPELPKEE